MSTKTLGTTANNSLTALAMLQSNAVADVASISQGILSDGFSGNTGSDLQASWAKGVIVPGAWEPSGRLLVIPHRGILKVFPGDWVGIDSQGWPILVSANSIANAAWTHT